MADNSETNSCGIVIKSEYDIIEDSLGSESSDENIPFKKQKISNGGTKLVFKQEPCTSDNDANSNGSDDAENAVAGNESEELNSSNEISETVENETSLNRMLRKILNEKKKV